MEHKNENREGCEGISASCPARKGKMNMNAGTILVLLVLLCIVGLVVRKIVKDKKAGKTCGSCSGNCSCCHGAAEQEIK